MRVLWWLMRWWLLFLLLVTVDHGFAALQEIYDTLVDLRTFVQINHSGFRKIVKKAREIIC